ncbi:MAG: secretin and TonB N-terminal domain-containing protein [Planctomycetes bacterium]|nr:secretin and TonB N-terminal domain-containing protein [Planctomycetota bacterium]
MFGSRVWAQAPEGESANKSIDSYLVPKGGDPAAAVPADTGRINLDLKDADLGEILQLISRKVGVNIIPDPEIKEKVSIRFDNMDWREALDAIARQTHCKIIEVSANYIRFTQPPSISMEFQDADIRVVLELLAKQSGANIVVSQDVKGKVSLSLRDVPWQDALDTIVKTNGFTIVRADTANSEIIRVVHPSSLQEQLETRHFTLKFVRPMDPYRAHITGIEAQALSLNPYSGTSGAQEAVASGKMKGGSEQEEFPLKPALDKALSKNGTINFDPRTNTFIIKDIKPKLDEIEHIIKLLDVEPPLIYLEVKFISTESTDILEHGIKFDLPSTPERDGLQIIGSGATPDPTADPSNGGAGDLDPLMFWGGTYPFDLGNFHRPYTRFFTLGLLDFTQTRLLLKLIRDDENSRVIQEPTLTVVNNQPATIFVGDTIPFAVQKIQQDQNGNITVAIDENKRSPINVGFTLFLIPHVIPGTDQIDLTVIPNVSRLSGTTSTGIPGFDRFSFQSGNTASFIDLPREAKQTVVTYLRVQDRQTAVIGGLHTEEKKEIVTKIPMLSNIPILGNLFTWKRKDNKVKSLIIMVTPHILRTTADGRDVYREAERKHKERDFFYKQEKEQEAAAEGQGQDAGK